MTTKAKQPAAARDWMFTDFDVSDERRNWWILGEWKFVTFQEEQCPETGRKHFQGFLQCEKRKRFTAMKKLVGDGVHLEKRRGTAQEAHDYCNKEESRVNGPWYAGEMSKEAGRGQKLVELMKMAGEGKAEVEIADADPATWARNYRAIGRYSSLKAKKRMWEMENKCFWGDAGAGKTRLVYETEPDVFSKPSGKWFDGYAGEEAVLIDDFTGDMDLSLFLKVLDRYPLRVEVKGGTTSFLAKRVYVTSNLTPEDWYPKATAEQHAAIRRRFKEMKHFSKDGLFPAASVM